MAACTYRHLWIKRPAIYFEVGAKHLCLGRQQHLGNSQLPPPHSHWKPIHDFVHPHWWTGSNAKFPELQCRSLRRAGSSILRHMGWGRRCAAVGSSVIHECGGPCEVFIEGPRRGIMNQWESSPSCRRPSTDACLCRAYICLCVYLYQPTDGPPTATLSRLGDDRRQHPSSAVRLFGGPSVRPDTSTTVDRTQDSINSRVVAVVAAVRRFNSAAATIDPVSRVCRWWCHRRATDWLNVQRPAVVSRRRNDRRSACRAHRRLRRTPDSASSVHRHLRRRWYR